MKAGRNRTTDLTPEEGRQYLDRCIAVETDVTPEQITDKTILGDTFSVLNALIPFTEELRLCCDYVLPDLSAVIPLLDR